MSVPEEQPAQATARHFIVGVGGAADGLAMVRECAALAVCHSATWNASHIELPQDISGASRKRAAEALSCAMELGATVSTLPAIGVAEGLIDQAREQRATDLVIGRPVAAKRKLFRKRLHARVLEACPELHLHLVPTADVRPSTLKPAILQAPSTGASGYAITAGLTLLTALVAVAVGLRMGPRGLDLLFLFPVITAAVRFGLRPSLLAVIASVALHNLLFVSPTLTLNLASSQSILMAVGLGAVAVYTSMVAQQLRGRLNLADRSASESTAIVTLAQELARADTWEETAHVVCLTLATVLNVWASVMRERDGSLVEVASEPAQYRFGLIDQISRDCSWQHGLESGRGTDRMAASDWRFIPLKTALGTLALIAIAREDGTDPVPADRAVLVSTLISMAALAHERLRLEDLAVEAARRSG